MLVAVGIPSAGFIRNYLWTLVSPHDFASPENDWKSLFFHHLTEQIMVTNPRAVKYFYKDYQLEGLYQWELGVKPALAWSSYALLTSIGLACLSVILRRQWVEHERFAFPLVKLAVKWQKLRQLGNTSRPFSQPC